MRQRSVPALIFLLSLTALLEATIQLVDPWRVRLWAEDGARIWQGMQADESRGYALSPGRHVFSDWSATILPGGTRLVPDTNQGDSCTLVLAGDSVTFGHGVSDPDTWANDLARALPDVHIVNAANDGYNARQSLAIVQHFRGDVYLYFYIGNDDEPIQDWQMLRERYRNGPQSSLERLYLFIAAGASDGAYAADPAFYPALNSLAARSDTLMVGQTSEARYAELRARYPAMDWIAPYRNRISRADAHANAAGNAEIAAALLPIVRKKVSERCQVVI